jgi:hypothetical protein
MCSSSIWVEVCRHCICHRIAVCIAIALPLHCHSIAIALPSHCHRIAIALPFHCLALPCIALPSHCHRIAIALPFHCHCIAIALPSHCRCIAIALPFHCHSIAIPLPFHCHRIHLVICHVVSPNVLIFALGGGKPRLHFITSLHLSFLNLHSLSDALHLRQFA